jgi:hypothetical protein
MKADGKGGRPSVQRRRVPSCKKWQRADICEAFERSQNALHRTNHELNDLHQLRRAIP